MKVSFICPVRDKAALGAIFTELCNKLAADLARKGYAAKTIGIKVRYDDFKIATRDHTLGNFTLDATAIRQAAGQCLKRMPLTKKLRLLGVRAATLESVDSVAFLASNTAVAQSNRAQAAPELIPTDQLF